MITSDNTAGKDAKPPSQPNQKLKNNNFEQDSRLYGRVTIFICKGTHHFDLQRIRSFSYTRGVLTFYTIGIGEQGLSGKLAKALFDEHTKWYPDGKDITK